MRGLNKTLFVVLYIFVLSITLISTAFGAITVVNDDGTCARENILFETYRELNSHTALYDGVYDKVFCYESLTESDSNTDTLKFPDQETIRNCWSENIVLKSTGTQNAHVGVPHNGLVDDPAYTQDICYGYLQCSPVSVTTNNGLTTHDQKLAALSGTRNAHISAPSTTDGNFSTAVYCWEPICDAYTYAKQTPFPNLYTFDSDKAQFELANLDNLSSIQSQIQLPQPTILSDEALFVDLSGIDQISLTPIRIQDWSGYAQLEFFIFYAVEDNITAVTFDISNSTTTTSFELWRYITTTPKENTWLKVRIPIAANNINDATTLTFDLQNSALKSSFFVESITFISKAETTTQYDAAYCQVDKDDGNKYRWISDADSDETTCTQLNGFNGTGNGCCGDDSNEYFVGPLAGCYDSNIIANNTVFARSQDSSYISAQICVGAECENALRSETVNVSYVIGEERLVDVTYLTGLNYAYQNNELFSCGVADLTKQTDNQGNPLSDELMSVVTYSTGSETPVDGDACVVVGDFVCSPDGYFTNRTDDVEGFNLVDNGLVLPYNITRGFIPSAANRTTIKKGWDDSFACCPTNHCYAQGKCHADMSENGHPGFYVTDAPDGETNRCIAGKWTLGVSKKSVDGGETGYCPDVNDCFLSGRGIPTDYGVRTCLSSGQSYGDSYCHEGNWTSRTAVIAKTIVDFAKTDKYTLFCDSFDKTLNYLGFIDGQSVDGLLRGAEKNDDGFDGTVCKGRDCVNNFCVLNPLSDQDALHFGTSLNLDLVNKTHGIGAVFNLTCDDAPNSDGYIKCDATNGDGKWYYFPDSEIVIFREDVGAIDFVINVFTDFFVNLANLLPFFGDLGPNVDDLFNSAKLYNRIYISTGGDVTVQGFTEKVYDESQDKVVDALYIKYESTSGPLAVCEIVDSVKESLQLDDSSVECKSNDTTQTYEIISTSSSIEDIWVEFTAKLRK